MNPKVANLVKRAAIMRDFLGDNGIPGSIPLGVAATLIPSVIESDRIAKRSGNGKANVKEISLGNAAQGSIEGALLALHDRRLGSMAKRMPAYMAITGGADAAVGAAAAKYENKKKGD